MLSCVVYCFMIFWLLQSYGFSLYDSRQTHLKGEFGAMKYVNGCLSISRQIHIRRVGCDRNSFKSLFYTGNDISAALGALAVNEPLLSQVGYASLSGAERVM